MQSGTNTYEPYSFEGFLQGWFRRKSQLLAAIANAQGKGGEAVAVAEVDGDTCRELIARVLGHFNEYYEHKSREAHRNVFALFSPTWCSSFECAFSWITGFRPTILLQLVANSVQELSTDQTRALARLKRETGFEEQKMTEELAKIQESIAAPPLIGVVLRGAGRHRLDDDYSTTTMEELAVALEGVVANADSLRATTATRAVEFLSPSQCLRFLEAAIQLQWSMRCVGMQRDHRDT